MIFDINIGHGVWPFRTTVRTPSCLVKKLLAAGVTRGWVHSMENVWSFDIDRCNQTLMKAWKKYPAFQAIPTLHEDYRQTLALLNDPGVPAGIIYPNYHGYTPGDLDAIPRQLMQLNKTLVIPLRQEDERNQHPLAQVAPVNAGEIIELCRKFPALKVAVLNAKPGEALLLLRERMKNLFCDSAFVDGGEPYQAFAEEDLLDRLVFGSGAPLLEPLAAVMKLRDFSGKYIPKNNI